MEPHSHWSFEYCTPPNCLDHDCSGMYGIVECSLRKEVGYVYSMIERARPKMQMTELLYSEFVKLNQNTYEDMSGETESMYDNV